MGSGGDFWGSRVIPDVQTKAVTLSARIHGVVGTGLTFLTRPDNARFIALQVQSDDFHIKPGYHPELAFIDGDISVADDEITATAHLFTAGDGPYQIVLAQAVLAGTPGVIIDTVADTLTRDAGSWLDEGFVVGQTVTLGGSASNNGPLTINTLTDTVMTVDENLTNEGSQTDLTLTAAGEALPAGLSLLTDYWVGVIDANTYTLHLTHNAATKNQALVNITAAATGGVYTIATFTAGPPVTTNTDGQETVLLSTESGKGGDSGLVIAMPARLTLQGLGGGPELVYWYLP